MDPSGIQKLKSGEGGFWYNSREYLNGGFDYYGKREFILENICHSVSLNLDISYHEPGKISGLELKIPKIDEESEVYCFPDKFVKDIYTNLRIL